VAVSDYIFLCFLLGNDFLPHFPALNIRNSGIDRLMSAYATVVSPTCKCLVDGDVVNWGVVRKLVQHAASREHEYIMEEYKVRDKQARRARAPQRNIDDELNATPLRDRTDELYIAPSEDGWQERYYRALFGIEPSQERIREICINYLEGLEWTLRYYTTGCPDWRWTYKYDYPPLLGDLSRFVPALGTRLLQLKKPDPVHHLVQLSYVLPCPSLHLLPKTLKQELIQRYPEWYTADCHVKTAFCKYTWEGHPQLAHIDLQTLEQTVKSHEETSNDLNSQHCM
jgi:5'-3' exonuclease